MSPVIQFSERDVLKGTIVEPAWYRMRIDSVGEAPAKASEKGPSTNYPVEGTILFNGDNGDTKFANVPIDWNFNSKAIGFAKGFIESLGGTVEANKRIELKAAEGETIDVFVENGLYNGRQVNRVEHKYRKPRPEVVAVPSKS